MHDPGFSLLTKARLPNPFKFGLVMEPADLVDREEEVAATVSSLHNGQRLFLIGPRRYGKTSILRKASAVANKEGTPRCS